MSATQGLLWDVFSQSDYAEGVKCSYIVSTELLISGSNIVIGMIKDILDGATTLVSFSHGYLVLQIYVGILDI